MSEKKIPQQTLLKCRTMRHPADGSKRWQVEGPDGTVTYDLLGNHLHFRDRNGEHDSGGRRWADQIQAVGRQGDDHGVIDLLTGHYRTVLAGGAR